MKITDNKPEYHRYLDIVGVEDGKHINKTYLVNYIDTIEMPEDLTERALGRIARGALTAKIEYIEMENSAKRGRKTSIPKSLDATEIPYLMKAVFHMAAIKTTDTANEDSVILGIYNNRTGIYDTTINAIHSKIRLMGCYEISTKDVEDIAKSLLNSTPPTTKTADPNLCLIGNGIYNKATKQLMPYTPDYIGLSKISVNYALNAPLPIIIMHDGKPWDVETWMRELVDTDEEYELLWQVIADTLQPNICRKKSVWLYSSKGNNGKGTFGQLIKNLAGLGNYSSLCVSDFSKEFAKEALITSSVNIADENDVSGYIDSAKDFKLAVTGDDIYINRKYEKAINFQFKGTNIQMFNGLPKTKDKTGSYYRRIILLGFNKSFTNNGERTYIKDDYIYRQDVLEYVLFKALNMEFDEFIVPESAKDLVSQYREENNPVQMFWNELKDQFVWDLLPNDFVYDLFKAWFRENNPSGTIINKNTMINDLSDILDDDPESIWVNRMKRKHSNVRSKNRMNKPEMLIMRYDLRNWMNPNTSSNRADKLLQFDFNEKYLGILRREQ